MAAHLFFLSLKYLLVILLVVSNIYFMLMCFFLDLQLGRINDTFNVYSWMIKDSENSEDPQQIVSYLTYAYAYYPSGTSFISHSSPLNTAIERGREQTIIVILLILQNKTNANLGSDLDRWIEVFGNEESQYLYNSTKTYRKEHNLSDLRTNLTLWDLLNCSNCSKEK